MDFLPGNLTAPLILDIPKNVNEAQMANFSIDYILLLVKAKMSILDVIH